MEYLEIQIHQEKRSVKRFFTVLPDTDKEIIDLHNDICRSNPTSYVSLYWNQGSSYLKGNKKYQDL